jgi:hypothetical protein
MMPKASREEEILVADPDISRLLVERAHICERDIER